MCFSKTIKSDPTPLIDEEGGIIEVTNELYMPEGIHEHIDNVYLNFDFEDGILAFVYENGNGVFIVWTSSEAEQFGALCEALDFNFLEY